MLNIQDLPLDINRQSELELLPAGWHALEVDAGRSFRWVDNDAAFTFSPALNHSAHVTVELEAGPGMGRQSFELTLRGSKSRQVFSIFDRQSLTLTLPLSRHQYSSFSLHADGGGAPCPNDDRQLNFRVFLLATPRDIVTLQSGVELLSGWGPLDTSGQELRRTARTGARVRFFAPRDIPVVVLDIDGGPSPFGLRIDLLDDQLVPVFTTAIDRRQLVCIRLPLSADTSGTFSFYLEWVGRHSLPPPVLSAYSLQLR